MTNCVVLLAFVFDTTLSCCLSFVGRVGWLFQLQCCVNDIVTMSHLLSKIRGCPILLSMFFSVCYWVSGSGRICYYSWIVRYLVGSKKELNDPATHKWMMYVRGAKDEPRIDHFVDKVIFLLHDTYKPNNIVTVTYVSVSHAWFPPFHCRFAIAVT